MSQAQSPLPSNHEPNSDTKKNVSPQEKKQRPIQDGFGQAPEAVINRLHRQHISLFTFGSLMKIYQRFFSHHWVSLSVVALILTTGHAAIAFLESFNFVKQNDSVLNALNFSYFFVTTLVSAFMGAWIARQFLLSPQQKDTSSFTQGFSGYLVYSLSFSCLAIMSVGFIYFLPFKVLQYLAIFGFIGFTSVVTAQYGLILPALSAERKTSVEIASQQIKPLFLMSTGAILFFKSIPFICTIFLYEAFGHNLFSASVKSLVNCFSDFSIYITLCAIYAGAGYLTNSEFKRDDAF